MYSGAAPLESGRRGRGSGGRSARSSSCSRRLRGRRVRVGPRRTAGSAGHWIVAVCAGLIALWFVGLVHRAFRRPLAEPAEENGRQRGVSSPAWRDERDLTGALARVPEDERPGAPRPADPHLRAARQVRRRPARQRPAGARGRERPRLVRPARADRRDRALRPGPRRQVRDLRDRADQGRDHRRAARDGLGAALGARARARDRAGDRASSRRKLHRAPTDEEIAEKIGITEEELEDSLTDISRSSIAALDELWTISSSGGDQVALIDTIEDTDGPEPQARARRDGDAARRSPRRSRACPSGRRSSSRSTTTRS